jgi:hypothetical protein
MNEWSANRLRKLLEMIELDILEELMVFEDMDAAWDHVRTHLARQSDVRVASEP